MPMVLAAAINECVVPNVPLPSLALRMAEHLNAEFSLGTITGLPSALVWLQSTFAPFPPVVLHYCFGISSMKRMVAGPYCTGVHSIDTNSKGHAVVR